MREGTTMSLQETRPPSTEGRVLQAEVLQTEILDAHPPFYSAGFLAGAAAGAAFDFQNSGSALIQASEG